MDFVENLGVKIKLLSFYNTAPLTQSLFRIIILADLDPAGFLILSEIRWQVTEN